MNNLGKILWGIVLIIIGIILGINMLGIAKINIFFEGWWTLFIIVPSFVGLLSKEGKVGNIITLILGILLLFATRDIISFDIIVKMIIPVILIVNGLSLLYNEIFKSNISKKVKERKQEELETIVSTFSYQRINKNNEMFESACIEAIFGSVTLDLSDADIKDNSIIKASSIFGGIKIFVPNNVNIKIKSTPIFGGIENKIRNNKNNEKTIYIDAFCMFGGVEIR